MTPSITIDDAGSSRPASHTTSTRALPPPRSRASSSTAGPGAGSAGSCRIASSPCPPSELLRVEVPHFAEARLAEATLNELVPVEYHADAVVLFDVVDGQRRPVFGAIFEVQLQRDDRKPYTWPLYATAARARTVRVPVRRDRRDARAGGRPVGPSTSRPGRLAVSRPRRRPRGHSAGERDEDLVVARRAAYACKDNLGTRPGPPQIELAWDDPA
jgi:hypothetical protein